MLSWNNQTLSNQGNREKQMPAFVSLSQWFPTGAGCRGTQGCREEVSGVPPNIAFNVFYEDVTLKSASDCHFKPVKGAANFLLILKGAVNQKRLKTLL